MNKYLPFLMIASLAACGGGGGGGTSAADPVVDPVVDDPVVDEPIAELEEGESDVRNALVVETSGGRYELTEGADSMNIAGEQIFRINVAAGPGRPNGGGFGTALRFDGTDVSVFAGTDTGQQPNFAAVVGDTVAPTGNATFSGHYTVADDPDEDFNFLQSEFEHGTLDLSLDFAAGTLTGTSDNSVLVVDATVVNGGELDGSVTVSGNAADIVAGGFFGADAGEVTGGFTNEQFGGYFYGAAPE